MRQDAVVKPVLGSLAPQYATDPPNSIEEYKKKFVLHMGEDFQFHSCYYRGLLTEMLEKIASVTEQFHMVFGRNIFNEA